MLNIAVDLKKAESMKQLDLRAEKLKSICSKKYDLSALTSRVAVVLDISSSMDKAFKSGMVQAALERIFPLAMAFDDNGEMEFWTFNNEFKRYPAMTRGNYYNYTKDNHIEAGGGTSYYPVLQDICKYYFCEEPAKVPNYIIFITDGDNNDHKLTDKIMKAASYFPVFFQFIGVGDNKFSDFKYLSHLDEMKKRFVKNANFFAIQTLSDIELISDDELYGKLLNEYTKWLEYPQVKEMLSSDVKIKHKRIKALTEEYKSDWEKYDEYVAERKEREQRREEKREERQEKIKKGLALVDDPEIISEKPVVDFILKLILALLFGE